MGDVNQLLFVEALAGRLAGPVLEVGSRDYGNTQNFRAILKNTDFLGIDMQAGKGVDLVLDLTDDFETVDQALQGRRFGTIICMSVWSTAATPSRWPGTLKGFLSMEES